ncbi:dTDP-glucose 4,6-dehydratase [candidate division WOR_3 bacterium SM23_42]|uniref:dTDP-glucose 4,6-dehydratase n=1 Tax=candidate division WOR_3 bacterium SM23_42 TaxID=1703779 RepID=A0A0S8FPD7_UNCW3|nr:MAG: dTDP-glucose 4,6-dehydratase [candidate division WOR_3 bacterium SM23_42]
MNVLVTGGCGFIGSNFIHYFNKKYPHHKVLNVDKLTYAGNLENLKGLERRRYYKFVKADICNARVMKDVFEKTRPDTVINFAAESHVDRSVVSAAPFLKTNFLGVSVLLNLSLQYKVGRFLQISTDEVYGSILRGRFTEESMINPSSPYAASKTAADALVISYYKTHGLPVLITRSSNNYGPYQFPEKLIPLTIINALGDKKIPIYGDGMNIRDWLYVEDNCAAIDLVLQHGRIGEIYNIAGENELTNMYVIKRILRYLRKDKSLMTCVADRPGHDRRYALSINKMKRQLGWYPKTSFEVGIKKTIDWYSKHKRWLKSTQTGEYRHFYKKYYTQLGLTQI